MNKEIIIAECAARITNEVAKALTKYPQELCKEKAKHILNRICNVIKEDTDTATLKDTNAHEFVDLGLPTGTLWAKCNVGAKNETDYGKYFAWGDTKGHYDCDCYVFDWEHSHFNGGSKTFDESFFASIICTECPNCNLSLKYDSARAQMGGDWRMPSKNDIRELLAFTKQKWVENYKGSGVNGRVFTSNKNGNTMFIPAAGYWDCSSVNNQGADAYLWSNTFSPSRRSSAHGLGFSSDNYNFYYVVRYYGLSVRGVI